MLVYRYENAARQGPYIDSAWLGQAKMKLEHSRQFHLTPAPMDDFAPMTYGAICDMGFRFGCASIKAFVDWFDGWHTQLIEAGFRVTVYETAPNDYYVGRRGTQVAFNRDTARLTSCSQ